MMKEKVCIETANALLLCAIIYMLGYPLSAALASASIWMFSAATLYAWRYLL